MLREKLLLSAAAACAIAAASPGQASSIMDPVGDFIPTYTGPLQDDLDVVGFSVTYDPVAAIFKVRSQMAGKIDPTLGGLYAIGVNTGTGTGNFAAIGLPGVKFNRVVAVQKDGTAAISGVSLPAGSVTFKGASLSVLVPLSMLPSTGFTPELYGWNIWPRSGGAGVGAISDFAPNNATIHSLPEPATWALMILGFGLCGNALRRQRATVKQAKAAFA